jgi:hypothetical protein
VSVTAMAARNLGERVPETNFHREFCKLMKIQGARKLCPKRSRPCDFALLQFVVPVSSDTVLEFHPYRTQVCDLRVSRVILSMPQS